MMTNTKTSSISKLEHENFMIRAEKNTLIKAKAMPSQYLNQEEVIPAPMGTELKVFDCKFEKDQHYWIQLPNSHEGYIYGPHWNLDHVKHKFKRSPFNDQGQLAVKYCNQRDNWEKYHGPGYRQCNLTSCCMMADYLLEGHLSHLAKSKGYQEPEDAYGEILAKYGDTTDHAAQTKALKDIGIESYFSYSASMKDLLLALDKGIPVVLGVAYKGSGHMVCAVGYDDRGCWVHDPYGVRLGYSDRYENTSGAYDIYSYEFLQNKWLDLGSEAGWARFVTHVKGKPTGIPHGL